LRAMLGSALFSVFPWFAAMLIVFPAAAMFDAGVARSMMTQAFLAGVCGWVVLPGLALLLGTLPVQFLAAQRLRSNGPASS
jgi:hypothetical protein